MEANTTLYLTAEEKAVFDGLSDELKEGWSVGVEEIVYEDNPLKQRARYDVMNVQAPNLQDFKEKAKTASTKEEIDALASELDVSTFNDVDITELFYALGPTSIGILISKALEETESDEDIQGILGMAALRHLLFGPTK